MIKAQQEVLAISARYDFPVVVLEYGGCGETTSELGEVLGTVPRCRSIEKYHDDGFVDTKLESVLGRLGIKCMGMMGINATACVKRTARGAPDHISHLTAEPLIADSKTFDGPKTNEIEKAGINWYQENALAYFQDYRDLIALMEAGC